LTVGPHNNETTTYFLFLSAVTYNSCNFTYDPSYVTVTDPLTIQQFSVDNHLRGAHLQVSGLTNNRGEPVAIDLTWQGVYQSSATSCNRVEVNGPTRVTITTDSKFELTNVTGTVIIGSNTFSFNGIPYVVYGFVYDDGSKTVSITK